MKIPKTTSRLRVATYNVHGCIGLDRRLDPARCLNVVRALDADIVGLQEVIEWGGQGRSMLREWSESLGMRYVFAPARRKLGRLYGNALLTRRPLLAWRRIALAVDDREPRNAVFAEIDAFGWSLKCICTHLGLSGAERSDQADRLLALADATAAPGVSHVLLGDFNEWRTDALAYRTLRTRFGGGTPAPSFPALAPWLALDRIWAKPGDWVVSIRTGAPPGARWASDHRPVVAELAVPPLPPQA